jgi:hypothetical protein
MPKDSKKDTKLQKALKKSAAAQGLEPGTPRYDRYVYGTMNKISAKKHAAGKPTGPGTGAK